jgi:hypothetical protein
MRSDECRPGATVVLLCTIETVAEPNIQRELTLRLGRSFPEKGGNVAVSIKGTYTASLES